MTRNVEAEFQRVRRTFFPRWDRQKLWRVKTVRDLDGAQGKCDQRTKTIKILGGITGLNLTVLLIHEIAHAVANVYHEEAWQARMRVAADKADHLGKTDLALLLRKQVADYADSDHRMDAATVYNQIYDLLWENSRTTFHQAMDFVRRDGGLTRSDFLRRYRRARAVFDKAKADAKAHARARERMRK